MINQRRAPKGGAVGVNGEFYKGGAFIAMTERPKGKPQRKQRKQEIEPYVWAYPPADGYTSLFKELSIGIDWNAFRAGEVKLYDPEIEYHQLEEEAQRKLLILAYTYKGGSRWIQRLPDGTLSFLDAS